MSAVVLTTLQSSWSAAAAPYEAELFAAGLGAIPPVFRDNARLLEDIRMLAKQASVAKAVAAGMLARAWVGTATVDTGWTDEATPTPHAVLGPDWLDFLAEDYGTHRTNGETDAVCRARLRTVPSGVIRKELLAQAQAITSAAGVMGTVAMLEMPRDAAYFGEYTTDTGVGGTFASGSFLPATGFASGHPPFWGGESGRVGASSITFRSATNPANNGTFPITGLSGDSVTFAGGAAGSDSSVIWTIARIYGGRYVGQPLSGGRAFFSRGWRMWRGQPASGAGGHKGIAGIILILPSGCTSTTRLSVLEMLRQRAAAGVIKRVELAP